MAVWMDYSGAPALLIPRCAAHLWTGVKTPEWRDYERACELAWPGKGIISIGDTTGYVLYSESDKHTWLEELSIYASGWVPDFSLFNSAVWEDAVFWRALDRDYLLVNSAEDLSAGLSKIEHQVVILESGEYEISYTQIEEEYTGVFHRFRLTR